MSHVNNAPCMPSILIPSPSAFQSKKRWTQRVDTIHQGGVKGPQDSKTTWQTMSVLLDFQCEIYDDVESWCIVFRRTLYLIYDIRNKIVTIVSSPIARLIVLGALLKDGKCVTITCTTPRSQHATKKHVFILIGHLQKAPSFTIHTGWNTNSRLGLNSNVCNHTSFRIDNTWRESYGCACWSVKLALVPKAWKIIRVFPLPSPKSLLD